MSDKKKNENTSVQILDISAINIENPHAAVKIIDTSKPYKEIKCDVFIAGGGLGGIAAALKLLQLQEQNKNGKPLHIILSEETDWLGGQATSQGVSAFDENSLIETTGCTINYQSLRKAIRNNYKNNHQIADEPAKIQLPKIYKQAKFFNPGNCWVSRLAFEPKIAVTEIGNMLAAANEGHSLKILYRHKPFLVKHRRNFFPFISSANPFVKAVYLVDLDADEHICVRAKTFIDATEFGDLLALSALPYNLGAESKKQTGEPHAPEIADTNDVQDFTYPFALEWHLGENHTIDKPASYNDLLQAGQFSFDGFKMFAESTRKTAEGEDELMPFWTYRRLIDATYFTDGSYPNDISMINWSGNDVRGKNIIDKPAQTQAEYLAYGKSVSLGFLYWLQTEAPRDDGGKGYPELALRKDIMGSTDGFSKHPYIRESRRAQAKYTITEQDIASVFNNNSRAKNFADSVGIGHYPIDIHGHEQVPGAGQATKPFQISLSSLLPQSYNGILPACKNIGVTHISNGAYRLHPIEWAIGEAQGALVHYCLQHKISPEYVCSNLTIMRDFQRTLIESGVPVYWFDDIAPEHPAFAAAQYLALAGIMPGSDKHLHFYPADLMNAIDAEAALNKLSSSKSAQAKHKKAMDIEISEEGVIVHSTAKLLNRSQFAIILYDYLKPKKI